SWTAAEQAALARLVEAAPNREAVLLAAAAVAKSGLPGSSRLVELVYAALAPQAGSGIFALRSDAVVLESRPPEAQDPAAQNAQAAIAAFAGLLEASFDASRGASPTRAAAPAALD